MSRTRVDPMAPPPNLITACRPALERLLREPPEKRIKMAFVLMEQLTAVMAEIAGLRRSGVRELRKDGWTLARIAETAGISISRVKQIEDPAPEKTKTTTPRTPKASVDPDAVIRQALEDAGR